METIFTSLHILDLDNDWVKEKEVPASFAPFILDTLEYAQANEKNKAYMVHNEHTQVVSCIRQMVLEPEKWQAYAQSIANKCLESEKLAQAKIYRMGSAIKKGSLVQTLVKKAEDEYIYMVAKIEHSQWLDSSDLSERVGFSLEKKSLWKSAVFSLVQMDQEVLFSSIQGYSDTQAKYWTVSFLELDEARDDAKNTYSVFKAVDNELKSAIEPVSKKDYVQLSSELQNLMNTPQDFQYEQCVDQILEKYHPSEEEVEKDVMKDCLMALPERKKFDTEFKVVPESLNNRRTKKFHLSKGIELTIRSDAVEYPDKISAVTIDGKRVIQIVCDDDETYETFQ